jgi:hypothetical protein
MGGGISAIVFDYCWLVFFFLFFFGTRSSRLNCHIHRRRLLARHSTRAGPTGRSYMHKKNNHQQGFCLFLVWLFYFIFSFFSSPIVVMPEKLKEIRKVRSPTFQNRTNKQTRTVPQASGRAG